MNNYEKIKKMKWFKRLYRFYFVGISVLAIITFYIVTGTNKNVDNYKQSLDAVTGLQSLRDDTDDSLKEMMLLCRLISGDESVKQYAAEVYNGYDSINFERILKIASQLAVYDADFSNKNISISMTRINDGIVISKRSTLTVEQFAEEEGIEFEKIREFFANETAAGFYSYIMPSEIDNNVLFFVGKNVYSIGREVFFAITFNSNNVRIINDRKSQRIIVSPASKESDTLDISGQEFASLEKNEITQQSLASGKKIYITPSLAYRNIVYMYNETDVSDKRFNWLYFSILLIVLIATRYIAMLLAFFTHMPMRKLMKAMNVNSAYGQDEIELIGNEYVSIKNENDRINRALLTRMGLLRNHVLLELLNGYSRITEKELITYKLSFLKEKCSIFVIECQTSIVNAALDKLEETDDLIPQVIKYLQRSIKDGDKTVICRVNEQHILYISSEKDRQPILSDIDSARMFFNVNLIVAEGEPAAGIKSVRDMFLLLESGLESIAVKGNGDIISADEIREFKSRFEYYPISLEAELDGFVKNGDAGKAQNRLQGMFSYCTAQNFNDFKASILITVKRIFSSMTMTGDAVFGKNNDVFGNILGSTDKDMLYGAVYEAIMLMTQKISERIQNKEDNLSDRILKYINDNIHVDLSMNDILDKFNISASHLRDLLKLNYNITFKKYLNDMRIKKAKEIMDSDNKVQIQDIARMVGFNSSVSFIRAFKRNEGITPKEYRDL